MFNVGDKVRYNSFPHEGETFVVVATKSKHWTRASATNPGGDIVRVNNGMDYVILLGKDGKFGGNSEGIHVAESQIEIKY